MAPERVFLHIGAPKTGTTYLQGLLALNRDALRRDGIWYPESISGAHHAAVWDLRGIPPQRKDAKGVEGAWDRLVATANSWDGEAVLVSSELFVFSDPTQVRRALSAFSGQVHVIYTARDLARQVPAVWQERVKNQETVSYPDFIQAVTRSKQAAGGRAFWRAGTGRCRRRGALVARAGRWSGARGHGSARGQPADDAVGPLRQRPGAPR